MNKRHILYILKKKYYCRLLVWLSFALKFSMSAAGATTAATTTASNVNIKYNLQNVTTLMDTLKH